MDVDLILLGPTSEKLSARMGVRRLSNFNQTFAKHANVVKAELCIVDDCSEVLQSGRSHAWTCSLHDQFKFDKKGTIWAPDQTLEQIDAARRRPTDLDFR